MNDLLARIARLSPEKRKLWELQTGTNLKTPDLQPRSRPETLPLSFAQEALWFLERLEPDAAVYNTFQALRFDGGIDVVGLRWALSEIMRRHEMLRTSFPFDDGRPCQRIAKPSAMPIPVIDIAAGGEKLARRLAQQEALRPFRLDIGQIWRAALLRLSDTDHVLLLTIHHIASDGWSLGILLAEFTELYAAWRDRRRPKLAELPVQYADFALWEREYLQGSVLERQLAYWKGQIQSFSPLELPTDWARPRLPSHCGAVHYFWIEEDTAAGLRSLSQREGATLFMTLIAAFGVLLARHCGQSDIVIGSPVANRSRRESEQLIGYFVNSLVLCFRVEQEQTFRELLASVRTATLTAYENQDLPFIKLVEKLSPERDTSRSPLFQIEFVFRNAPLGRTSLPGVQMQLWQDSHDRVRFDLTLAMVDHGDGIAASFEYATDLFHPGLIERLADHFVRVVKAVQQEPDRRIRSIGLLGEQERLTILETWNATTQFNPMATMADLLEQSLTKSLESIALAYEGHYVSYGELNHRANRVAEFLRGQGAGAESIIGVLCSRSVEMVVALLGVIKSGAAYLPLEPEYPVTRLQWMVQDAKPLLVLTSSRDASPVPGLACPCSPLDGPDRIGELQPNYSICAGERNCAAPVFPASPVYIMYTSGSTGTPKGVVTTHAGIVNRLRWIQSVCRIDPGDRVLQKTPFSFDVSVGEFFWPLLQGATLVVASPAGHRDAEYLSALIAAERVTVVHFVPSMLEVFLQQLELRCDSLRDVLCSGEALSPELQMRFHSRLKARLHNLYGPTEAAVEVAHWESSEEQQRVRVPIGRPIWNTRLYVLGEQMEPAPVGIFGELYISGEGLARGYLRRPSLTAERFLPDPYGRPGSRMYQTGDWARWTSDGILDYLGRTDRQTKIRGLRVELGEIESVLLRHPAVAQTAVVVREDKPGDKKLVAYYTRAESGSYTPAPDPETLREYLSNQVPEFMVPSTYVVLEKFPLTPNGKLEGRALPAPGRDAYSAVAYVSPEGPVENIVASLWSTILQVPRVGRFDNFFRLGGHSLLVLDLVHKMRLHGLQADVRTLFTAPTLAAFAEATSCAAPAAVPANGIPENCHTITPDMLTLVDVSPQEIEKIVATVPSGPSNIQDIYPLTPLQEGILFHHLIDEGGDPYLMGSLLSFDTRDRLQNYLDAVQLVVNRHDILRTGIVWEGLREPVQVVWRNVPVPIREVELNVAGGDAARKLHELFDPRHYRMDVGHPPLLHIYISQDRTGGRWLAMQLLHHLVDDNTALQVMREEVEAILLGKADQLPQPLPFREFVTSARAACNQDEHEAFFRRMLRDVEEPTAPFGLLDVLGDGSGIRERRAALDPALTERIRKNARSLGVSAASICHLAWAVVLSNISGRDDVVFGTVLFGRMHAAADASRVVGPFINTLPIRIRLANQTVESLARGTHQQLGELMRHEHTSLVLAQRCSSVPSRLPLFSALLNYRHAAVNEEKVEEKRMRAWAGLQGVYGEERTNYPISLSIDDMGSQITLLSQVHQSLDPSRICGYMITCLESLLVAMESSPATPVRVINMLPASELKELFEVWNNTRRDYSGNQGVQDSFESRVTACPDSVAVVFDDQHVTYSTLNRHSNQLAHQLMAWGIGPEDRVGLCLERSVELITGLLGILKAGAAYVPLDPEYPSERLEFMLRDADARVLVSKRHLRERFSGTSIHAIWMEDERTTPATNPPSRAGSQNLAYVIYTSGSTGAPKGVAVTHLGLVNYLTWAMSSYPATEGRAALVHSSISFDLTVTSIYPSLLCGRGIELVPSGKGADAVAHSLRRSPECNVLKLTPSHLRALNHELQGAGVNASCLVIGGEPLAYESLSAWQGTRLINEYGPTETVVGCCIYEVDHISEKHGWVPIGRPISNTHLYVLDDQFLPVPAGVSGDLYIGGHGVARGYLNRPGLTAERFVPDPFSRKPGARMYCSHDLARWRLDGNLEYLGRLDEQIKIRGYRIEPGEIEAALQSHPQVREAAVITYGEDEQKRLAGYVTLNLSEAEHNKIKAEVVQDWRRLYEATYAENTSTSMDFNLAGWTSNYTGLPIAPEEMGMWLEETVGLLRSLHPRHVLEIGCGTGLLLTRFAGECDSYVGMDFSSAVLAQLASHLKTRADLAHVRLHHGVADDLSFVPEGSVDLVILNSVAQYFPDVDYLLRVLEAAARTVGPSGRIFIGDVRSLSLLDAFHTSVQAYKAAAEMPIAELRRRIAGSLRRERELVIAPDFFRGFVRRCGKLGTVRVSPKQGGYDNELSRFRYNVIIQAGEHEEVAAPEKWLEWDSYGHWRQVLKRAWASGSELSLGVRGIPDRRVTGAVQLVRQLRDGAGNFSTVSQLRESCFDCGGEHLDAVAEFARAHKRDIEWNGFSSDGMVDVIFSPTWRKASPLPEAGAAHYRRFAKAPVSITRDSELGPQLQHFLRRRLPEYMVPTAIQVLDSFPVTRNGKIDRSAFPKPELRSTAAWRGARTPEEELLCGLFAEVLGVDRVGLDDNFFEAGGHSLMATSLLSRIRSTLGVEVSLRTLFDAPTVGALGPLLRAAKSERPPLLPQERPFPLTVSYAQQRMLFIDLLSDGSPEYNIAEAVLLKGDLGCAELQRSAQMIVCRHESLRTRFWLENGEPCQVVLPDLLLPIPVQDLSELNETQQREAIQIAMRAERHEPFDMTSGPLLRLRLLKLRQHEHVLLKTIHHVVSDGWSQNVFNQELAAIYAANRSGKENPLPPLPVQYADFALWQRKWLEKGVLKEGLAYWKETLAGAPPQLELPTDRPRPPVQTYAANLCAAAIPLELSLNLRELCQSARATLYMAMLAAFSVLAWRYSGQDDIVVGSPIANRHEPQLEGMIGLFVNNLAMRIKLRKGMSFRQLVSQVRGTALDAYRYQEIPFEKVVEEISPRRSLSTTPVYQVLFALQNTPSSLPEFPGLEICLMEEKELMVRLDLEVHAFERPDGIDVEWLYNRGLFDPWRMEQMARDYVRLIKAVVDDPDCPVEAVDFFDIKESVRVLQKWNDTGTKFNDDWLLSSFQQQVAHFTDRIAASVGDSQLTYGQLNHRAESLAALLRSRDVGPETIVGLVLPRSLEMIVAIVALLKLGAAYLPLDADVPPMRMAFMLNDARPSCIVTTAATAARLSTTLVATVNLDSEEIRGELSNACLPAEQSIRSVNGESLAYIMYTSGSTGKPKGVAVTHRGVANILQAIKALVPLGSEDVGTLFHSFGADISVWEFWAPLVSGARLVVLPVELARSPADFRDLLLREQVTLISQTPAALYQLIHADEDVSFNTGPMLSLQTVVVGGEPLESKRLRAWRLLSSGSAPAVYNMYGPTEVSIWATSHKVVSADLTGDAPLIISIGNPLSNYEAYILGPSLEPLPPGVTGDLYIGGAGLARAYNNRPALTAEAFVPYPFGYNSGARLYRTGDLARWLPGGTIEFIGRADDQVKLRGYRIELGEVAAALLRQPEVREAAAIVREDEPGNRRLTAYIVAGALPPLGDLNASLRAILPEYMVPSSIVPVKRLPLSANGKLDRNALPKPDSVALGGRSRGTGDCPRDNTEAYVTQVWEETLGVRDIGIYDNFFDIGGHSMNAVVTMAKFSAAYGRKIPMARIFQYPTVEQFSSFLRNDVAPEPCGTAVPIQKRGALPPLFCVHAAGGLAGCYAQLGRELGPDQPLYAFQSAGFEEHKVTPVQIEDMAAQYVADLRKLKPQGAYQLLGWSLGGLIAYEMAQQLSAAGEVVSLLALLDCAAFTHNDAWYCRDTMRETNGRDRLTAAQLRRLRARLEEAKASSKIPPDITMNQLHAFRQVYAHNAKAGRIYRPGPYLGSGSILLVRTREGGADPTQGWGRLAGGRVQVAVVSCGHHEMVFAPHVKNTAAILRKAMSSVVESPNLTNLSPSLSVPY